MDQERVLFLLRAHATSLCPQLSLGVRERPAARVLGGAHQASVLYGGPKEESFCCKSMGGSLNVSEVKVSLLLHLRGLIGENGGSRLHLSEAARSTFFLADAR